MNNFTNTFNSFPPVPRPQPAEDKTLDIVSFVSDSSSAAAGRAAEELDSLAAEIREATATPEMKAVEGILTQSAEQAEEMANDFRQVERELHVGGAIANGVAAVTEAVNEFRESDATTDLGRVGDAALKGGAAVLAGAALPVAAAELATGGEVGKLYFAGGKALEALMSAAKGDFGPAAKFNEEAAAGKQGWVAKEVNHGVHSLEQGIPEAISKLGDWL